jgi:hypothetical protein
MDTPARREKHDLRRVAPSQLEAVVGAEEIRADDVPRVAVEARQGRGFRRALQHPIDRLDGEEVGELANITVDELHAGLT